VLSLSEPAAAAALSPLGFHRVDSPPPVWPFLAHVSALGLVVSFPWSVFRELLLGFRTDPFLHCFPASSSLLEAVRPSQFGCRGFQLACPGTGS